MATIMSASAIPPPHSVFTRDDTRNELHGDMSRSGGNNKHGGGLLNLRRWRKSKPESQAEGGNVSVISGPILIETTNKSVIETITSSVGPQDTNVSVPVLKERSEFLKGSVATEQSQSESQKESQAKPLAPSKDLEPHDDVDPKVVDPSTKSKAVEKMAVKPRPKTKRKPVGSGGSVASVKLEPKPEVEEEIMKEVKEEPKEMVQDEPRDEVKEEVKEEVQEEAANAEAMKEIKDVSTVESSVKDQEEDKQISKEEPRLESVDSTVESFESIESVDSSFCTTSSQVTSHSPQVSESTIHVLSAANSSPEDLAQALYEGRADFIAHEQAASWLGDADTKKAETLKFYMDHFDWKNLSILRCLRSLCDKLYLKAESQQLNKILHAFTTRWITCNPFHGFQNENVVYTISFSVLLLNTDLQAANKIKMATTKTSRSQYIRRTLEALDLFVDRSALTGSAEAKARFARHADYAKTEHMSTTDTDYATRDNMNLINDSTVYTYRQWIKLVTETLKYMYDDLSRFPLQLASNIDEKKATNNNSKSRNMSVTSVGSNPQSSSASISSDGSRQSGNRILRHRGSTASIATTIQEYADSMDVSSIFSASRKSFMKSQSTLVSSSKSLLGIRSNAASDYDYERMITSNDFQQAEVEAVSGKSIINNNPGIMNWGRRNNNNNQHNNISMFSGHSALSSPTIPEEDPTESDEDITRQSTCESLTGVPWTKEGDLKFRAVINNNASGFRKYAKVKQWVEISLNIRHGQLKIYQIKGANDDRILTDNVSLCHTLAQIGTSSSSGSMLPQSKGSSLFTSSSSRAEKSAENNAIQWTLLLPDERMLIFQAESKEEAADYVYVCNYWAARVSREPLVESITNAEFGWTKPIELLAPFLKYTQSLSILPKLKSVSSDTVWIENERIQISTWKPPVQSLVMSGNDDKTQLEALQKYEEVVRKALEDHSAYRAQLMTIFDSECAASSKVHSNWENRSRYLLTETLKYDVYVSVLKRAIEESKDNREKNKEDSGDTSAENNDEQPAKSDINSTD